MQTHQNRIHRILHRIGACESRQWDAWEDSHTHTHRLKPERIKLAEIGIWFAVRIEWWTDRRLLLAAVAAHEPYNFVFKVYLLWCNTSHPLRLFFHVIQAAMRSDRHDIHFQSLGNMQGAIRANDRRAPKKKRRMNFLRTWCDRPIKKTNFLLFVCTFSAFD